jgi:hypothetical protein
MFKYLKYDGTNDAEILKFVLDGRKYPEGNQHLNYDPESKEIDLTYVLKTELKVGDYVYRYFNGINCTYNVHDEKYFFNELLKTFCTEFE